MQPTSNTSRGNLFRLAGLLLLVGFCLLANAQFNGPGASTSSQLNQPVPLTTDASILNALPPDFKLQEGDVLAFHVYAVAEFNSSVRVSADGTCQLPLIGLVHVQGLTIPQAENLVAKKLIDAGMIRDPQVTIQVVEAPNRVATIIGEVRTPTVFPVLGQRRLIDAITLAGGLSPTASHIVTIHRPGVAMPIVVDLGTDPARSQQADIPIFSGDTIVVSRVGVVYALGGFKSQGLFTLNANTPLTLMQAFALAGGTMYDADLGETRIIRTVGTQRSEIRVDFKKIMRGHAPDPILQADDIVFVPTSLMKAAIRNGGFGTVIGLASVLVFLFI